MSGIGLKLVYFIEPNGLYYQLFLYLSLCTVRQIRLRTLQSLTGKYREIQGKPCNENREPAMRTGFPCNESRFFPVGIDLQGFPVSYTGFGFAVQSAQKQKFIRFISVSMALGI